VSKDYTWLLVLAGGAFLLQRATGLRTVAEKVVAPGTNLDEESRVLLRQAQQKLKGQLVDGDSAPLWLKISVMKGGWGGMK
jgi:hypothetical protein